MEFARISGFLLRFVKKFKLAGMSGLVNCRFLISTQVIRSLFS